MAYGWHWAARYQKSTTPANPIFEFISYCSYATIPVYLCMGRYDYITPSEDAFNYYEELVAPDKHFIWFEESAHFPHFEEVDKFHTLMIDIKERALSVP